ncbi:MAG: TetR/AcrR family transcriptional regulator [Lachnospiraceae bacterium]|nr:TetR/AcrR family transcriptional regulator [Lachnospiraceae bacterium]
MPPKVMSERERNEIKEIMFKKGLELIKKSGFSGMSVSKITKAAGLGKSTFYNYFESKETFVVELIEFGHIRFWMEIEKLKGENGKISTDNMKYILRQIVFNEDSIYQYLSTEEEKGIIESVPEKQKPDIREETAILKKLFDKSEGIREDIDYAVVSNILKIIAISVQNRNYLHETGFDKTIGDLYELLYKEVFV